MTSIGEHVGSSGGIPELHCSILARRGDVHPIRGPGYRRHYARMAMVGVKSDFQSAKGILCQNTFRRITRSDIVLNTLTTFIPNNVTCKSCVKSSSQLCIKKGCSLMEGDGGYGSGTGLAGRDVSTNA